MLFDQLAELTEQAARVVRPGRGLGVILHAKHRLGLVAQPLDRLVVEVDPVHRHVAWQRVGIDRETVVLRGDLYPAALEILHRLVGTAMRHMGLNIRWL